MGSLAYFVYHKSIEMGQYAFVDVLFPIGELAVEHRRRRRLEGHMTALNLTVFGIFGMALISALIGFSSPAPFATKVAWARRSKWL